MKELKEIQEQKEFKNEVVAVETTISEILPFERVDFQTPSSMLSYGNEAKTEIANILEHTSALADDREELQVDEKLLSSILNFDETLDESEKERNKKELAVVKGVKGFLSNLGVRKYVELERKKSYKAQFDDYCTKIEELCEVIESQKQASLNDIELRNSIISEMIPYIEMLEEMIRVGKEDKESYDQETEKLKKLEQTQDIINQISYRTQISEYFNGKLTELEKALVAYKEQIQSYRLQQITDMELVKSNDTYLKDASPILKAQGSVMVFNHQQEGRLESMRRVNEVANMAIAKNGKELVDNAEKAVELSLNSGISVETLQTCDVCIKKGVQIYIDGRNQRKTQIEQTKTSLFDNYQREMLQLIDDEKVIETLTERKTSLPKIKARGTYGNKRS